MIKLMFGIKWMKKFRRKICPKSRMIYFQESEGVRVKNLGSWYGMIGLSMKMLGLKGF